MQQPCQRCGYVSDRPARFCRQCGAQLFVENEATSAPTRQQPPQQSSNPYDAPYQSQLAQSQAAPDSRFDGQTPDTSRLYHAPVGQNYPSYPSNYQPAEPKKSGALKWVLIVALGVVMVSCGIGALVISAINAKRAASDQAIAAILEEAERAKREMEKATIEGLPVPPPPPPPANVEGLDRYKYPNATVKNSVSVMR